MTRRPYPEMVRALEHQRPEVAALADARRNVECAVSALRAAVTLAPTLGRDAGAIHAALLDQAEALREIERCL